MRYFLSDRIYDTLKFHKFYVNGKEVFIDKEHIDYLTNKLMTDIKTHFEEAMQ